MPQQPPQQGMGGQGQQCPFCQLVNSPEQTFTVHESDNFKAWLDINPRARGHTMVVPKDHQTSMDELGPDLLAELFNVLRIVGEKARNGIGANGVSFVINDGEAAGQRLDHFYAQVFPRFQGEENEGAPAGAVFQPIEELEESDLEEIGNAMADASFREQRSPGGPGTALTRDKRGEEPPEEHADEVSGQESDEAADRSGDDGGSWDGDEYSWKDDSAEFT